MAKTYVLSGASMKCGIAEINEITDNKIDNTIIKNGCLKSSFKRLSVILFVTVLILIAYLL